MVGISHLPNTNHIKSSLVGVLDARQARWSESKVEA